ncbi:MAG: alpha/beta hydrolase [Proteobacteria bacterium]|nr:alpha/beta hydrolase [Pseudomonadota bacterium]
MRRVLLVLMALVASAATTPARADKHAPPRWKTLPLPAAMPAARTTGLVDVGGGVKIYYARYGSTEGTKLPPVILLHGGLGNSDHFSLQLPALVDKLEVITIDSRGQGRSSASKAPITYDLMAKDVVAVMDELKVAKASVFGWSDGGEVALKLAIGHPDRVEKLVVLGANYDANGSKSRGSRTETFAQYSTKCRADFARMAKLRTYDQLVDSLVPLWHRPMGFTKDQLRAIQAPTLLADGDHDEVIELAQVKEMAQLIPHGRLLVIEDASHFVMWQAPKPLNDAIVDFLTN